MLHGDESDSSYKQSVSQDGCRAPLRKPRTNNHDATAEERTESPQPQKSVLQMKHLHGQAGCSSGTHFASPIKAQEVFKARNKFVLSPDAAIFVPREQIYTKTVPPAVKLPSVQDRLNKFHLTDKYNSKHYSVEGTVNGVENVQIDDDVRSIVETLENFAINLGKDPGLYNNVQDTFMSFLYPYINDPKNNIMIISDTASMLFMHSVDNPNFRYSGARLCTTIVESSPEFQVNLILLCEKNINCNTQNTKGLLLFIAELYMNKMQNSQIYGNMLVNGFYSLLSTQTEDNIVAACQILKLTGRNFSVELPTELEGILCRLDQLKQSVRNNIQSLIETVKKNCEIKTSFEKPSNNDEEASFVHGMEDTITLPIFISQEGVEVALEDASYSGEDDSDMEEMCNQYEEFLKISK